MNAPNHKLTNFMVVLLAITTIAAGVIAWNAYHELAKLHAEGLDESAKSDLQKRIWALEKRNRELETELAGLRGRTGARAASAEQNAQSEENGPRGPGMRFGGRGGFDLATLLQNPEFNKLWTSQQKAGLDARYGALFKSLNLSPADLDKLKNLLLEKQNSIIDVMAAAREGGLDPRDQASRQEISDLLKNAEAQADATLKQLLGDAGFTQYQNYEQTLSQRSLVNQLVQTLSYSDSPLQSSQIEQLVSILAANSSSGTQTGNERGGLFAMMGGNANQGRSTIITDAAIAQAQSVLTTTQLQALQQMQAQQQAQQQINQMMRQAARSSGSTDQGSTSSSSTRSKSTGG